MGKGFVYLVGAGPGRADLITVRGAEALKAADCIIYDKLANPALLRFASAGAEVLHVPKRACGVSVTQEEINKLMIEQALAGRTVARLKGGDPCIFGRCSEELAVLIEHGIGFEVIPGVSSGIAVAAGSDTQLNWFMQQPLFGRNIVVTRDVPGNIDFANKIICRGGSPKKFPTIKIKSLTQKNGFLHTLAKITEHDWIIFTSGNGVAVFFEALQSLGKDARIFGSTKIAAIGGKTAAKLSEFGIKADFVPGVFTSKELGRQLIAHTNLKDKKVLLLRSKIASNELAELLEKAGAKVQDVAVYTAEQQICKSDWLIEGIDKGRIDWLTFASPSSANAFFEQITGDMVNSANVKIASIGPVTSERLKILGVNVDVTAAEHTLDGLIDAIEKTY